MFVILESIASVCLILEFLIWLVKKDHFRFKIFRLVFKIIFKISFIILYCPVFIKFQNSMMMKQSEITIWSLAVKNQHCTCKYHKVASSRLVYYSILELLGQKSQYTRTKLFLQKFWKSLGVLPSETVYCSRLYDKHNDSQQAIENCPNLTLSRIIWILLKISFAMKW